MANVQDMRGTSSVEATHPSVILDQQADNGSAPQNPTRTSSIRFSEDTNISSQSSMPTRQQTSISDEITPIRAAGAHSGRKYNATEETVQAGQAAVRKPSLSTAANEPSQQASEEPRWYKRIVDKYGSVSLDNKGSVARDHLALERTFLAWLRTSLAFASIGIAVTQLFRLNVSLQGRSQSMMAHTDGYSTSRLPYAPMMGYGLPPELIPLLQQLAIPDSRSLSLPNPGATLLDQLLTLPSSGRSFGGMPFEVAAFDKRAAAKLRHVGKPLGATFIGISIVVLCVGFHRYFEAQYWIMRGKFPASRGGVALIGLIAAALIIASFVVVIVIAPGQYEKR